MILTLDIEELRMIAGYAHWIPGIRGLYKDYFAKNLPGWEWNQIIPVLIQAKILVRNSKDPAYQSLSQGLSVSREITSVTLVKSGRRIKVSVEGLHPLV
jgi:hypothetical protein